MTAAGASSSATATSPTSSAPCASLLEQPPRWRARAARAAARRRAESLLAPAVIVDQLEGHLAEAAEGARRPGRDAELAPELADQRALTDHWREGGRGDDRRPTERRAELLNVPLSLRLLRERPRLGASRSRADALGAAPPAASWPAALSLWYNTIRQQGYTMLGCRRGRHLYEPPRPSSNPPRRRWASSARLRRPGTAARPVPDGRRLARPRRLGVRLVRGPARARRGRRRRGTRSWHGACLGAEDKRAYGDAALGARPRRS